MAERDTKNPLPCFVCGRELSHCGGDLGDRPFLNNQPCGGLGISSQGHYGSTVFDPMHDYNHLELAICDECLIKGRDRTREISVAPSAPKLRLIDDAARELATELPEHYRKED